MNTSPASPRSWFFCGIGGSGMLPLALILHARGDRVQGSDRALDQGQTPEKFDFLRARGIDLYPQDGSGLTSAAQILVASTAVEDTVPDMAAAIRLGATVRRRAEVLAELFNATPASIGIAGTSGKSTVTGMTSWLLDQAGRRPTIMNGAVMNNFQTAETPFASSVVPADSRLIVSEIDESDGSIELFSPDIGVLTNISEDHQPLSDLRRLFGAYLARAGAVVLNADDAECMALAEKLGAAEAQINTFSLESSGADLLAVDFQPGPEGIGFTLEGPGVPEGLKVSLAVPGAHNVANALAAILAAHRAGTSLPDAARSIESYTGLRRRMEFVGTAPVGDGAVTVIDDFGHNPDKITATLQTLRQFPGRLLVMFQPHGFGPLRLMREGFVETFAGNLTADDILLMPEPVYFGGTVERDISSGDITGPVAARGRQAEAHPTRADCGDRIVELARAGDRVVVMGARDDSLAGFARDLVQRIGAREHAA